MLKKFGGMEATNQLNQQLINNCQRIHYKKEELIDELWKHEQKQNN